MNVLTVRRLESGDQHLCREMNMLFAREFDDAKTYTKNPPSDAYFEKLLGKPHIHALVALEAGEVVGALVAYELDKFEEERCEIYIYDLAVTEEKRRQCIATALIEHLKGIGRERNAWVIYVQADYGDHPAIGLYNKLGTREDVMHFDIAVTPQAPS
jgi:aminoglycoside 3-N-acetyltransferase I